jgi:hypothetical protein
MLGRPSSQAAAGSDERQNHAEGSSPTKAEITYERRSEIEVESIVAAELWLKGIDESDKAANTKKTYRDRRNRYFINSVGHSLSPSA